jgi:hypothetical protein
VKQFSKDVRIVPILSYASGTADRTSTVIDTRGYSGFCVVVHFATIAASAVTNIYLQHAAAATDNNTLTSGADVVGTSQAVADDDDNEVKYIDVKRPVTRFYQLVVNKDATNACAESAVVYLYGGNSRPATQAEGSGTVGGGADITEGEAHVSPITGDE